MMRPWVIRFMSFWPPFVGAGVRVKKVAPNFDYIDVEMKLRFWNANYVGTHFGGSMYSMTDPFIMLILIQKLGRDYIVWDKSATIRFKKPGKGRIRARFSVTEDELKSIVEQAAASYKVEPVFVVQLFDEQNEVVAEVDKVLYVRRKDKVKEIPIS
nr:YiiD C-terminal domain-containing protein [Bdellovibrio sp. CKG001]BFD62915.1 YiiD C-terminal domain-containing protein [Bdellovibrio sp. HM001]